MRRQLYVLAHECAHILLHNDSRAKGKPTYLIEIECEWWAHAALRRHGVVVPELETRIAVGYIMKLVRRARARGRAHRPAVGNLARPRQVTRAR
jgi:hypothetical protein